MRRRGGREDYLPPDNPSETHWCVTHTHFQADAEFLQITDEFFSNESDVKLRKYE